MNPTPFTLHQQQAVLQHVNLRKEGPEDNRHPACDLKFQMIAPSDVLLAFSSTLRVMLYNADDGSPRYTRMGAVDWDAEIRNMLLDIFIPGRKKPIAMTGVKLKKFVFRPLPNWKLDLTFSVQADLENANGIADQLHRVLLEDGVAIDVKLNGDLLSSLQTTPAAPPAPPPPPTDEADGAIAVSPDGEPLGFRLDKKTHPVGTECHVGSITYEVTGQGESTITLAVKDVGPAFREIPDLTDELLAEVKEAGKKEAQKEDGDLEKGMKRYLADSGFEADFIEEHAAALERAYTDGFEEAFS